VCGIFGIINANAGLDRLALRRATTQLLLASRSRGSEAAGAVVYTDEVRLKKSPAHPYRFVRSSGYRDLFRGITVDATTVVIGHTRMVTNGSAIFDENNQPATAGPVTLVHNGIVTNFSDLAGSDAAGESDTAALARHLAWRVAGRVTPEAAVAAAFGDLNGSASIAVLFSDTERLVLATNTGSLHLAYDDAGRVLAFASEAAFLTAAGFRPGGAHDERGDTGGATWLDPGTGLAIDRRTGDATAFTTASYRSGLDDHHRLVSPVTGRQPPITSVVTAAPTIAADGAAHAREFAAGVQRCVRCILPETIPFLTFDHDGVCSQCHVWQPYRLEDPALLSDRMAAMRARHGDGPHCIVAFSGGRDSAWGLHLLVREYGVRPVTLTYDWGMVTDLARRNQARLTGALGVEQVLISADIARKRDNIARNLRAWARDPALGMLPLLTAGDKQFFLHARRLSTRLRVQEVIFCVNPREMTYFKAGFAGIEAQRYYTSATFRSKARMIGYYARRFARSPGYLNRSLLDTAEAAYATYLRPHDYLQLFEWVDWDEDHINRTLADEYGWETDPTTATTWRIGDGTAPFYNYVYWRCVGFTENDTFRANQVREGVITRERALELVAAENEPRWTRIQEYLDLVGVDSTTVLQAVERLAGRSPVG
jgi:hypothetical protein